MNAKKVRAVPLTAKVLRGIETAFNLGYADMEACGEDWDTLAWDEVDTAARWLTYARSRHPSKAKRTGGYRVERRKNPEIV